MLSGDHASRSAAPFSCISALLVSPLITSHIQYGLCEVVFTPNYKGSLKRLSVQSLFQSWLGCFPYLLFPCSPAKVSPSTDSAAFPRHNRKNSDPIINWNEGPAPLGRFSSRCTNAEPWPASVKWNAPVFNWTNCTLVFSVSCNEGLKRLEIAAQRGNQTEGGVMVVLNHIYVSLLLIAGTTKVVVWGSGSEEQ